MSSLLPGLNASLTPLNTLSQEMAKINSGNSFTFFARQLVKATKPNEFRKANSIGNNSISMEEIANKVAVLSSLDPQFDYTVDFCWSSERPVVINCIKKATPVSSASAAAITAVAKPVTASPTIAPPKNDKAKGDVKPVNSGKSKESNEGQPPGGLAFISSSHSISTPSKSPAATPMIATTQNLYIRQLKAETQNLLAKRGFDLYQNAFSAQLIKNGSRDGRSDGMITPLQFFITKFYDFEYQTALDDLLSHADSQALHNGPMPALAFVLKTCGAANNTLVKKIKSKSSQEDIQQALKIAKDEQEFRTKTVVYYSFWFFETLNLGNSMADSISRISEDELTQLVNTLQ